MGNASCVIGERTANQQFGAKDVANWSAEKIILCTSAHYVHLKEPAQATKIEVLKSVSIIQFIIFFKSAY